MLKKELEAELGATRLDLESARAKLRGSYSDIETLNKAIDKMEGHRDRISNASTAIRAIMATNCTARNKWMQDGELHHRMHQNEEPVPEMPEDRLYDALFHIERLLQEPVTMGGISGRIGGGY